MKVYAQAKEVRKERHSPDISKITTYVVVKLCVRLCVCVLVCVLSERVSGKYLVRL